MKPRIVDSFPFFNELDLLQMRLEECYDAVDAFVAVEADVDHQGHPKPFWLSENLDRFDPWLDKLIVVRATDLPTVEDYPNAWSREQYQREFVKDGLAQLDLDGDDVILHGDVDEIPRAVHARNVRPEAFTTLLMRAHFWAVDWQHPDPDNLGHQWWCGTVAAPLRIIDSFAQMRNSRRRNPTQLVNAGWHFSWLGGEEANRTKAHAFCHPETIPSVEASLEDGHRFLRDGLHMGNTAAPMIPVDVDESWPAMIHERRCPPEWFRPRAET